MITTQDIAASMKAGFTAGVKAQLAANGRTDWKQADSVASLLELAKAYHDVTNTLDQDDDVIALVDKDKLPLYAFAEEQFKVYANDLANPSAFRQWLAHKDRKLIVIPEGGATKTASSKADLVSALK